MAKFNVGDTTFQDGGTYSVKENEGIWANNMFEPDCVAERIKKIYDQLKKYEIETNIPVWIGEITSKMQCVNVLMPNIVDYKYNHKTGETHIKWADKTETRVKPESNTVPNQYVGFVTAYAKRAAGNTSRINGLFDKWAFKKPILDKKTEAKRIEEEIETKRIIEKRKAKREKWLIRKEALRIKREYEAKKLANEKYGVPMNELSK